MDTTKAPIQIQFTYYCNYTYCDLENTFVVKLFRKDQSREFVDGATSSNCLIYCRYNNIQHSYMCRLFNGGTNNNQQELTAPRYMQANNLDLFVCFLLSRIGKFTVLRNIVSTWYRSSDLNNVRILLSHSVY